MGILTITDCLDNWANHQPDSLLFTFHDAHGRETERYTYRAFAERTAGLAEALRARGLSRGQRALLLHPPGLELVAALFACARIGVIGAVAPSAYLAGWRSPATRSRLATIAADCAPAVALVAGAQLAMADGDGPPFDLPLLATDALSCPPSAFRQNPHEILLLQYTSGSTSSPKGVVVSHRNVIENARALLDHVPIGVSWLPQFHDMGLIGYYLFPVVMGGRSHGLSPVDFLRRPSLWLRMMSDHRATFASAPDFGFDYCLRPEKVPESEIQGIDLSSLKVLLNGAEPVRPETCRRFVERFRAHGLPRGALVAAYGLAEGTLAVTQGGARTRKFDADSLARGVAAPPIPVSRRIIELASCGPPLANLRLEIRSPRTGEPLVEGVVGEICVAGVSVASCYWDACRAAPGPRRPDGVAFRTRDLGFLLSGDLYVCGRSSDLIIRRGQNYHPQDIEAAVRDRAVRANGCVAFAEEDGRVTLLVEARDPRRLPDPLLLASQVVSATGLAIDRVVVAPARSASRTSSGKLSRGETRRRLEHGEIRPLLDFAMSEAEALGQGGAVGWLAGIVARAPDLASSSVAEAGIDSLRLVQLQLELEEGLRSTAGETAAAMVNGPALQHWTCGEILVLAEALRAGDAGAARCRAGELARAGTQARADEKQRIAADAMLPLPARAGPDAANVAACERILLTGATGFFGPFLLDSLLKQTALPIQVIARGASDALARARVIEALSRADLHADAETADLESRLTVWRGDLTAPSLGLSEARWEELAGNRLAIYHNGAAVDYVRTYDALRPANVEGTHRLLVLAMTGAPKRLHHVSSTFVFGWTQKGLLHESYDNAAMEGLDFGYSQSKWVAEQLVRRAGKAGLPVTIYRPALISVARSSTGDSHDVAARLLAFMIRHGVAVDSLNELSLLPADVLAHNLVAISIDPRGAAGTYHLTADRYHSLTELTRRIERDFGYSFRYFDIPRFIAHLNALARPDDPVFPLLDFFNRAAPHIEAMSLKRYNNRRYRAARDASPTSLSDPPLEDIACRLVIFLLDQGWIAPPAPDRANAAA